VIVRGVAYYNYGRWVVDCPGDRCTNAKAVEPSQQQFVCRFTNGAGQLDGCDTIAPIDWPADPAEIQDEFAGLPESQQSWEPADV
jgi:hypothetical protein